MYTLLLYRPLCSVRGKDLKNTYTFYKNGYGSWVYALNKISKTNAEYFIRIKYTLAESRPVQAISTKARTPDSLYINRSNRRYCRVHTAAANQSLYLYTIHFNMYEVYKTVYFFFDSFFRWNNLVETR